MFHDKLIMKCYWLLISTVIIFLILFWSNTSRDNINFGLLDNKIPNYSPLIFVHIPKNAGTSIEDIAKKNSIGWGRFEFIPSYTLNNKCGFWHDPDIERVYDKPSFCVVRNPYTRIISEYRYRIKNKDRSLKGFNEYIADVLNRLTLNLDLEDCHWMPQTYYTKNCDYILRFENLEYDFNNLMKKFKLPLKLEMKSNVSEGLNFTVEDISRSNLEMINRRYQQDFIELGYNMI